MARYTGPRTKKSRRYGVPLFGSHKALERRNYPPGMHGDKGRRKQSEYATALGEKQKLRLMYGLLERRLDNIVFRLGLANSRRAARQMVNHGHINVNGRRVSIASYNTKIGDVIEVRNNAVSRQLGTRGLAATQITAVP